MPHMRSEKECCMICSAVLCATYLAHTHTHTHTHKRIFIHMSTISDTHTHTYTHMYMRVQRYTSFHLSSGAFTPSVVCYASCIQTHTHTHTNPYLYIYMHIQRYMNAPCFTWRIHSEASSLMQSLEVELHDYALVVTPAVKNENLPNPQFIIRTSNMPARTFLFWKVHSPFPHNFENWYGIRALLFSYVIRVNSKRFWKLFSPCDFWRFHLWDSAKHSEKDFVHDSET